MEFNLFQLLILLFIFYPLIKRLLGGLKGAENETGEAGEVQSHRTYQQPHDLDTADRQAAQRPSRSTAEQKGEQSWEDFFEGLEKVISGSEPDSRSQTQQSSPARRESMETRREPVRRTSDLQRSGEDTASYRHPSHGPVGSSGSRQSNPFTYKQDEQREIGRQGEELSQELEEGDNPIYQTLDESPEVVIIGSSGRKNVKRILGDPEKLRDGIMLKEILDPHRSRRRIHHASR